MSTITTVPFYSIAITDPELASYLADEQDAQQAAVDQQAERLAAYDGQRIRVQILGRKMDVPGRLYGSELHTNWGAVLDLSSPKNRVLSVSVKDPDSGRFVSQEF